MSDKKRISIVEFFSQVKAEVKKITWPSRQQVIMSTILIFVVSVIAALFFFVVDQLIVWVMKNLYSLVG